MLMAAVADGSSRKRETRAEAGQGETRTDASQFREEHWIYIYVNPAKDAKRETS